MLSRWAAILQHLCGKGAAERLEKGCFYSFQCVWFSSSVLADGAATWSIFHNNTTGKILVREASSSVAENNFYLSTSESHGVCNFCRKAAQRAAWRNRALVVSFFPSLLLLIVQCRADPSPLFPWGALTSDAPERQRTSDQRESTCHSITCEDQPMPLGSVLWPQFRLSAISGESLVLTTSSYWLLRR
eukprot:4150455-Amphidinium_carterae.1